MPFEVWANSVCASGSIVKISSENTDESNALLNVPITIPERAGGSSKSRGTENTT